MGNNKQRLFEVMGKVDKSFKPKLNESTNEGFKPYNNWDKAKYRHWSDEKNAGDGDAYDSRDNGEYYELENGTQISVSKYDKENNDRIIGRYNREGKKIDESNTDNQYNIEEILNSYLETALWAEGGDGNEFDNKTIYDFDESSLQVAKTDINKFLQQAQQTAQEELSTYDSKGIGHNLWLSRQGHGAGFFDDNNDELQNIARGMKSADMYVGDNGKVYFMGAEPKETGLNELANWGKTRANPKYTHFAVSNDDNMIVTAWEYGGYDPAELRQEKRHYFFNDLIDWEIDPKSVKIVTTKHIQKQGIDPYDYNNWKNYKAR